MTEGCRSNLREPIHHLSRQPRYPGEHEVARNRPRFLSTLSIHHYRLATEISLVLELGFNARDVDRGIPGLHQKRNLASGNQIRQSDLRLLERSRGWESFSGGKSDCRSADRRKIPIEPSLSSLESFPSC